MRFDDLFNDLAAQAAAVDERVMWDEAQEMARAEAVSRTLLDRLAPGSPVRLVLRGAHTVSGTVVRVGRDVLVVDSGADLSWVVPGSALRRMRTGPARAGTAEPVSFAALLRRVSRDRPRVRIAVDDGGEEHGRLIAVGADHLELAVDLGERVVMAFGGIAALGLRATTTAESVSRFST
jgi:hypothetical protein